VPGCLILLTKRELKIWTPCGTSFFVMAVKMPFLNSLLISFYYKLAKSVSYIMIDMSAGVVADVFPRVR
jgi:hypothetical protein